MGFLTHDANLLRPRASKQNVHNSSLQPAAPASSVAREALAPVTGMITTLVAIAIGLGIAISTAIIVWGGIEKMLAGANSEAEHRAQRRITSGITGLVWIANRWEWVST